MKSVRLALLILLVGPGTAFGLLMGQVASSPVLLCLLVFIQMLYVTMVYGPIAAFLVEFFPAKIRYTSLSIPYHLGNGEFGGWLPFIAVAITAATGNALLAIIYPIVVAGITFVIGTLFVRETRGIQIWDEVGGEAPEIAAATSVATRPAPAV